MSLKEGQYKVRKLVFGDKKVSKTKVLRKQVKTGKKRNVFYIRYKTTKDYNRQLDVIKGRYETRLKDLQVIELKPKKRKYKEFIDLERFAEFIKNEEG